MLSSQREKKASAYLYKHREAYGVDRNSVHVLEQSIENVALAYIHNYYPAASYTKAPFAVTHTNSFSCIFFLYNFFFCCSFTQINDSYIYVHRYHAIADRNDWSFFILKFSKYSNNFVRMNSIERAMLKRNRRHSVKCCNDDRGKNNQSLRNDWTNAPFWMILLQK